MGILRIIGFIYNGKEGRPFYFAISNINIQMEGSLYFFEQKHRAAEREALADYENISNIINAL